MDSNSLQNFTAEQNVVGSVLLDAEEVLPKAGSLTAEDFTENRHRLTWGAVEALHTRNEAIDLTTVTAELQQCGELAAAGGSSYLAELVDGVVSLATAGHHLRLVRECSARRRLAEIGRKIVSEAVEAENAGEALDQAESLLMGLRSTSGTHSGAIEVSRLLGPAFRRLEDLYHGRGNLPGIPTGFPDLDRMTCGLQPGDLVIVAGRPSMGKTALALNVAENAAVAGQRVLVFSLEMNREQLVNRLLASSSRIDANRFRNGQFGTGDWSRLTEAAKTIHGLPIIIDDRRTVTPLDIRATARRTKRKGGLGLMVIDYLQLVRPVKTHQVREREVAEISRSLKAIAGELNVPVVVLAQLNRGSETGAAPRRPIPSDLRESGSLEQDADLILFPWREAAYCEECRRLHKDCGAGHFRQAEVIVGKHRNGPTGSIPAAWLGEFTRFEPVVNHD